MKVIILLGPPGSGKGTQADCLQEELDLEYIGSGDMLRARSEKDDFTGQKLDKVIDAGKRAPTSLIFRMWMEKFEEFKGQDLNGFIMDGSPRRIVEAKLVEEALDWYEWDDRKAIFIDVSEEESTERLLHRRICRNCGEIYPYTEKYKDMDECEECGGELVTREDDTKEGIEERWNWYKEEVKPVVDFFEKKALLRRVDGEQSIEQVFEDVLKAATEK